MIIIYLFIFYLFSYLPFSLCKICKSESWKPTIKGLFDELSLIGGQILINDLHLRYDNCNPFSIDCDHFSSGMSTVNIFKCQGGFYLVY